MSIQVAMDKIPLSAEWRRALEMLANAGERGITQLSCSPVASRRRWWKA
jgi:hypothetical protein